MWLVIFILAQAHSQCHGIITSLPEFAPFTETMHNQDRCERELSVGHGRVMNRNRGRQVPVAQKYTLFRRDESTYEAVFNMNFRAGRPAPSSTAAVARMEERTRRCVAMIPPINGPDGRRLRLRVVDNSADHFGNTKPPRIDINVIRDPLENETFRGSAADFQESFSCATIVHEVLHYAGLCDEYREGVYTGAQDQSSACRPRGPADSIMSDGSLTAYDLAVGAPQSCDLSNDIHLPRFFRSNSPLQQVVLRRGFFDLQTFRWRSLGLSNDGPDTDPMRVCCRQIGDFQPYNVTADSRRISVTSSSESNLLFENITYDITVTSNPRFFKSEMQCNPSIAPDSGPHGSLRGACAEFIRHLEPQLQAAANPSLEIMSCPHGSTQLPPSRFDIAPGRRVLEGNVIHLRSRGNGRPLLHTGHFNRILAGKCSPSSPDAEGAALYDQCADYSYKVTRPNCSNIPAQCTNVGWVGELVRGSQ